MPVIDFISGLPARAQVSLNPVTRTCTVTLLPVTFIPVIGDVTVTCMCLAPIGSIPPPIDMDGLAIGIELDISAIGDLECAPAAEGCPGEEEAHPAAASASTLTPTAPRTTQPGRERPRDEDTDINGPPPVPAPANGHHHRRLPRRL